MSLVKWDQNMSVNVDVIDKEHKKLVDTINELHEAMKTGKSKEVMGKILSDLYNYTKSHFATEENYFDKYGYQDSLSHKNEHSKFVQHIEKVKNDFDNGSLMVSMELMKFLKDWLIKHIQGTDKKYSQFLNKHGVY